MSEPREMSLDEFRERFVTPAIHAMFKQMTDEQVAAFLATKERQPIKKVFTNTMAFEKEKP